MWTIEALKPLRRTFIGVKASPEDLHLSGKSISLLEGGKSACIHQAEERGVQGHGQVEVGGSDSGGAKLDVCAWEDAAHKQAVVM